MASKEDKNGKHQSVAPEADLNDTIAGNRALAIMDPNAIPKPPSGYKATAAEVRLRRLRRFSSDMRAEAINALMEAKDRDLKGDLGKFAPDPQRAPALASRLEQAGHLVANIELLAEYAREMDQIATSDALLFLEAENKHLTHAIVEEPSLRTRYRKVLELFAQRSGAIAVGMARAKAANGAPEESDAPAEESPKDAPSAAKAAQG